MTRSATTTIRRLTRPFYARDALTVARELIGCVFFHASDEGTTAVRLVETEAYRGPIDPKSHGYRGETPRTRTMYGPPGYLYVYFTYGMHWCANVVCGRSGECEAVLLRAGEPVAGGGLMRVRRGVERDTLLAAGPARLAQAMGIDRRHDGETLLRGGRFWCATDAVTSDYQAGLMSTTPRIGVGEGPGADWPWRYVVPGHAYASRRT